METKQIIVVRKDLKMRKGKMCAQVSHAAMMPIAPVNGVWGAIARLCRKFGIHVAPVDGDVRNWMDGPWVKIVVSCDSEEQLKEIIETAKKRGLRHHICIDAGKTEFGGNPTLTCASFGPAKHSDFDGITDGLPLL